MANESDNKDLPGKRVNTRRFKNITRRLRDGKAQRIGHRASLDWRNDHERICGNASSHDDVVAIRVLIDILSKSRTAAALMEGTGLSVCYDSQLPGSQFYPREEGGIISLNPDRPLGDLLNSLSRELRRAWQHRHGALINPMSFEPEQAVLVNRAQSADALMVSIKVAWELKLVGEDAAWNFIAGGSAADVQRVFELHARKDFRSLNNGEASRAAYDKFFEEGRTRMTDKRLIHQMLLDDAGYMKAPRKNNKAGIEIFSRLGELPHGRNYLSLSGRKPPMDMAYASVEDRSNANFLWFIKFERSFQEKEAQMMAAAPKVSAEIIDFASRRAAQMAPAGL